MTKTRLKSQSARKYGFVYFMLLPTFLYLLVFQAYPLIESLRLSFTDLSLLVPGSGKYIGVQNYVKLLTEDANFQPILLNTFKWVLCTTPLQILAGLAAALVLNQKLRLRGLWRGLAMAPWVTPMVITGLMWKWIFDGGYGLLNYYLGTSHVWLGDESTLWPALFLVSVWKGFPYVTVMLLAGLQGIPGDLYEAAAIDGCGMFKKWRYVTLPSLMPVIGVTTLLIFIQHWTRFELVWSLTQGGPGYRTSMLQTYVYTKSFRFYQLGEGSAVAVISALLVMLVMIVYLRLMMSTEEGS